MQNGGNYFNRDKNEDFYDEIKMKKYKKLAKKLAKKFINKKNKNNIHKYNLNLQQESSPAFKLNMPIINNK
jgi:hypothetical protein